LVNAISKTIETLFFFFFFLLSFCFWVSGKHPKRDVALNYNWSLQYVPKNKNLSIVWLPIAGRDRNMANLTQDCSFCDDFSFQKTEIL
jgi:hypothetical protein